MILIPQGTCERCKRIRPSAEFTWYTSDEVRELICGPCFNEETADLMGVPVPDPAEYPPLELTVDRKLRTFVFHVYLNPGGLGIRAHEVVPSDADEEDGFEFMVLFPAHTPSRTAYEALVDKIERGVRSKYLSADGRRLKKDVAVGRFASRSLVIDGRAVSWDDFQSALSCYEGWQFRIEILDCSEDPFPRPRRPRSKKERMEK